MRKFTVKNIIIILTRRNRTHGQEPNGGSFGVFSSATGSVSDAGNTGGGNVSVAVAKINPHGAVCGSAAVTKLKLSNFSTRFAAC